jgi:hypothetical protein
MTVKVRNLWSLIEKLCGVLCEEPKDSIVRTLMRSKEFNVRSQRSFMWGI